MISSARDDQWTQLIISGYYELRGYEFVSPPSTRHSIQLQMRKNDLRCVFSWGT